MATTTVRLDPDEERALDELAAIHGGRSQVLREGLRLVAEQSRQRTALAALLEAWEREAGPVDDARADAIGDAYGL